MIDHVLGILLALALAFACDDFVSDMKGFERGEHNG